MIGNPDFGLDFLLPGKSMHLLMKKYRFQAVCKEVHLYKVGVHR